MKCYTIGHDTRELDEFLDLIKLYEVDCIIDIRTEEYNEDNIYNRKNIEESIKQCGINYIYMGKELGCKNIKFNLENKDEFLDEIEDEVFKNGLYRIVNGIKRGHKIAIMCIEKNPLNCKRAIILGYVLKTMGVQLEHIISDVKCKTQERIEEELFIIYEPILNKKIINLSAQDVLELQEPYINSTDIKNIKMEVIKEGYKVRVKELKC